MSSPTPFAVLAAVLGSAVLAPVARTQTAPPAPLATFGYDRTLPLEPRDSLLRIDDGVSVHAVSFASPRGGRVTGFLLVPPGPGPFPAVIVQHGAPGSAEGALRLAMPVVRHGALALAIDAPWSRRRAPPVTFTPQDSVDQVQLIVELQRAVDLLLARPDVDRARLGYVGRSYGGAMGALFAGVERRLATYVLQVGDGGLVSHFTGDGDPPGPPRGVTQEQWERWLRAMEPIEPIRFVGRAGVPILFQSGRLDTVVPPADAERLFQAASEPRELRWYDAGHPLNDAATADLLAWFHQRLGTRAPATAP